MKKSFITVFSSALALIAGLNILLFFLQPGMLFFPSKKLQQTPGNWNLEFEDVYLNSTNGNKIHGWFIPSNKSKRVVLFLHGNGGNISHRGESLLIFNHLGLSTLIIDYQGYGKSEGTPGENAFYNDARVAFHDLVNKRGFQKENIIVFGRSLGGAVAAKISAELKPGAVILESTFSSVSDMAERIFPILSKVIVLRYQFETARHVQELESPLLVLHSREDEIIPFASGEQVYLAANKPKLFFEITGDHNNGFLKTQPGYEQVLAKFLELGK